LISFGAGSLVTATSGVFVGALVGFAFIGVGKPLFDIGAQTYVSERVPYRSRARSLGILELSWAGGFLFGAPLAGWLIDLWSWEAPFWVFGAIALIALGGIALVLEASDSHHRTDTERRAQSDAAIVPFLVAVTIAGFTLELVFVTLGAWLEGSFGLSLAGLAGVGALLGAAEFGGEGVMVGFTDRIGKRNSFAGGLGIAAVFLGVLALVNTEMAPALIALFMVIMSLELAVISAIPLATELRPARRSRFLAWFLVAAGIGRIIADLIGPAILENTDMTAVALTAAGSALAGMGVLFASVEEPGR